MGKTPMPLRIMVDETMLGLPEITKLREQGHEIISIPFTVNGAPCDMILHPNAWNMHANFMDYLAVALKAARAVRYPERAKREPKATKKKATKKSPAVS